jgi:hypothetical protein
MGECGHTGPGDRITASCDLARAEFCKVCARWALSVPGAGSASGRGLESYQDAVCRFAVMAPRWLGPAHLYSLGGQADAVKH